MNGINQLKKYCLKAIQGKFETNKIEKKAFLDIGRVTFKSQFIKSVVAIANTSPDPIIPYGILIVGVSNGKILNNLEWVKDDNVYQNLVRK